MDRTFIIGGGLIGLLCAWYLRSSGDRQAHVIDRQLVGRELSWAGGGILSPLYPARYPSAINDLTRLSADYYGELAKTVNIESGVDPELQPSGIIIVDPDVNGTESRSNLIRCGQDYSFLTASQLEGVEPRLRHGVSDQALYLPSAAQVRNSRLIRGLRIALANGGTVIDERRQVSGFKQSRGSLSAIVTTKGTLPADRCIVAAGAWSGRLLATTGLDLPIRPIRGQMILIKGPPEYLNHIIVCGYRYLVPRRDGRILVGSTLEDVGFDKSTTPEARTMLHEFALDLVPGLSAYPVEAHWAGLRPGSPDSLPFIGEHPAIKGLYICTGHYRNGFALGPATAQMVVDMVLGRPTRFDPSPFRLDRPIAEDATY